MKRILSLFICVIMLFSTAGIVLPSLASAVSDLTASTDDFAEDLSELYAEESEAVKTLEESAKQRVIVKANSKPEAFGDIEFSSYKHGIYVYRYDNSQIAEIALEYYNNLNYVEWAELDGVAESQAKSYGNPMVQGDEAKEYIVNNNITKNDIVVAVVDTGAAISNPEYNGRVIDSGINFSGTGVENSAADDNGHGSNVTSVIVDNTSENIKVRVYKALDEFGIGTNSSIASAVYEAINDKVDVINLSLSSYENSEYIRSAIEDAEKLEIPVIVAAGNDNDDVSKRYPAAYDNVFTVGSIDRNGNKSILSNYGEEVDFVAPGHYIELNGDNISYGTSFAAPFVTAAAAMILSVDPDLTINEVKDILIQSCVPYDNLAYHDGFHIISDYDTEIETERFIETVLSGKGSDEKDYYGNGMPQIANAISLTLNQNTAVQMPQFSFESGVFNEAFEVTINVPDGYAVYYTTDESYPSKLNGTLYSEPIQITSSQSVRAVTYSETDIRSLPVACEYEMQYPADEADFTVDENGYITAYNGSLTEFVIPDVINGVNVTGIGNSTFSNSETVIAVTLPEKITYIGDSAFERSSVERVTGSGVNTIGKNSFYNCENLFKADFPSLETAGNAAFNNCRIRTAYYPKLKTAGRSLFMNNDTLSYVYLPEVTEITRSMFTACKMLISASFDSAISIGNQAFSKCYWLKELNAPLAETFDLTKTYTYSPFYYCFNLNEISLPDLTYVPDSCFDYCQNLKSVNMPNVIEVGEAAFGGCYYLCDVYLPKAETIGKSAFFYTISLEEVHLESATFIDNEAFKRSVIKSLYAENLKELGSYIFADYSLWDSDYVQNKTLETFYAPNLETAADYAFAYTGALEKLELPSLTTLGTDAFLNSGVAYFDAPMLTESASLPTAENSIAILSSEFIDCTFDATGSNLTIYGTPGTYAESYANQYELDFIAAPAIINDLPAEYTGETLTFDVAGFNKTYQWYGTNNVTSIGTPISGATEEKFTPDNTYRYYYCIVTSKDGDYPAETVKTALAENLNYLIPEPEKYDASIKIQIPETRHLEYGESVTLYASATGLPEGAKIRWRIVEGTGVEIKQSSNGRTCKITAKSSGNVTVEAYAVDKQGNAVYNKNGGKVCDREGISSEVTLWMLILSFLKQLFTITKNTVMLINI